MKNLINIALSERTYGFLIGALLVSLPLRYAYSSILLIILLAVALFSSFYHKNEMRSGYWVSWGLFVLMILSLLWTENFAKSLRGLERQLPFLIIPLAFWFMPKLTKSVLHQALFIFSIGLSVLAVGLILLAGFTYWSEGDSSVFFYHNLVLFFDLNAIYISVMVSLSLLYMLFYQNRTLWNNVISITLLLFLILLSSKNLIIITVIAGFIGFLIARKINRKKWTILTLIGVGIFTILFFSPLKDRWNTEFSTDISDALTCDGFSAVFPWTGTTFRLFQGRIFYESFKENNVWFTGFGINAAQDRIAEKQNEYFLYYGYNTYNYHNQYIQTFAELGLFGFVLLLLFFVVLSRSYIQHREPLVLFFMLVMASVFLTETYIWRQRGMIHFLTLFCLFIHLFPGDKSFRKST
jgi:O-antigen ligase